MNVAIRDDMNGGRPSSRQAAYTDFRHWRTWTALLAPHDSN